MSPEPSFCDFRARVVPENILKKQARDAKLLKALKESRDKAKADRAAARKLAAENAEKYFNELLLTSVTSLIYSSISLVLSGKYDFMVSINFFFGATKS